MRPASFVLPFEKPVVDLVGRVRELREMARSDHALEPELRRLEERTTKLARELFAELTPWQTTSSACSRTSWSSTATAASATTPRSSPALPASRIAR
jgi:acetyl-CoA carboxylase alpha subunit